MNKREGINKIIKDSITEALIHLMRNKEYSRITISEIVKKAGVSRISFYRNFNSKEDIIIKYLEKAIKDWGEKWEQSKDTDIIHQVFKLFNEEKELIDILYKANLQQIIAEQLLLACKYEKEDINIIAYTKSMVSYSIFGLCNEWYKRGMKESAEEVVFLVKEYQKEEGK